MFDRNQKPAGEGKRGKECGIRVPIKRGARFMCRRCGYQDDDPKPHYGMMQIVCPGGVDEFTDRGQK